MIRQTILATFIALSTLVGAANAQPSSCNDFTAFVTATQGQTTEELKFDVLDDAQIKNLEAAFGEIPFTGYDKVIIMHTSEAGMILFVKGNCILGRSRGLDYGQLREIIGQEVHG